LSISEKANITLTFDQERLPTLIQLIYGSILKKNYTMDPAVASRTDLVSLRTGPQTRSQVELTARLLLKSYGVAVLDLGGGMFRIVPDSNLQGYAPEIRRGRALPEVPLPLRPIFQLVELQSVRNTDVAGWIKNMFPSNKVTVMEDPARNAIMLSGQSDDVAAAMEAVQVLDRPSMKGRHSARINPVFLTADELAKRLSEVLTAEGYSAGTSASTLSYPLTFLPVPGINTVIAFAADHKALDHALAWARDLDQPSISAAENNYFTYQVRNTDAERLADTLRQMFGGKEAGATGTQTSSSGGTLSPTGAPVAGAAQGGATMAIQPQSLKSGLRVVVNTATNTLIFQGDNQEYRRMLNLLKELDKPAKAALIEVTVAEVKLDDALQLGVELNTQMLQAGALAAFTGGAGLTVKYLKGSQSLDMIKALASQNRAKILSSPRLMARNGETAIIQVGQEVPFPSQQLGSAASSGGLFGGSANLLTTVQYKNVGVILKVKPVIYSGDRIELEVTQEVSDAQSTTTGVSTAPTINTKKVETRLALKDGSTVMLGGLISDSEKAGDSGVPLLKDLPLLGQLFGSNNTSNSRQELVILITPYTVLDDNDAHSITDAFRRQLGVWASDSNQNPTPSSLPQIGHPRGGWQD
jgi:general secretion pathway protein D